MRGLGGPVPMTVTEIAHEAGVQWSARQATFALGELMEIGLIELRHPQCYLVPRFTEKTKMTGAERMQQLRDEARDESVTPASRSASQKCDGAGPVIVTNTESSGDKSPSSSARRRSPRAAPKEPKTPDTAWVEPLRAQVKAVVSSGKALRDLTPDERFTLGRYHAWRWANCTKTESKNRAGARKIARQIGSMANDKTYGSLTVKDYVSHGEAVWKAGAESPWWEPWDIKARVEIEAES